MQNTPAGSVLGMDAVRYVLCDGEMRWHGVAVACGTCGATRHLRWCVWEDPMMSGDLAWLLCPSDHQQQHPLVYPEAVQALAGASSPDEATTALQKIRWRPHELHVYDGVDVSTDATIIRAYQSWDRLVRGVRVERWPEFVAAAEAAQASVLKGRPIWPDLWNAALAVAEALVEWDRDTSRRDWHDVSDERVAEVMVLVARAITRAAAARDALDVGHPDDLMDLPIADLYNVQLADEIRDVVLDSAEVMVRLDADVNGDEPSIAPRYDDLGRDAYNRLVELARENGAGWDDRLARARGVLMAHIMSASASLGQVVLLRDRREALQRHAHITSMRRAVGESDW